MRRLIYTITIASFMTGCGTDSTPPEPKVFAPLADLQKSGQAVVRLYAAQIPFIEQQIDHHWFVIKYPDSEEFHRWEHWIFRGPDGYIRRDMFDAEHDIGAGGLHVVDELVGSDAQAIVDFIETQSPSYPCRNSDYVIFPGPNSASYIQWVLNQTGWRVDVPFNIIGVDVSADCVSP